MTAAAVEKVMDTASRITDQLAIVMVIPTADCALAIITKFALFTTARWRRRECVSSGGARVYGARGQGSYSAPPSPIDF